MGSGFQVGLWLGFGLVCVCWIEVRTGTWGCILCLFGFDVGMKVVLEVVAGYGDGQVWDEV